MQEFLFEMSWVPAVRTEPLTYFFTAATRLGSNWFALIFLGLGLLFWRKSAFARLIVLCVLSEILNAHLKAAFTVPRPDPSYQLIGVSGWSFPSGHAQHATVMWLWLAYEIRRPWAWILGTVIAFAVALSRVYLGVHYGSDIVAGAAVGLLMLAYFRWLVTEETEEAHGRRRPLLVAALLAFQLLWMALAPDRLLDLLVPLAAFAGFGAGIFFAGKVEPYRRWGILVTVVVIAIGVINDLSVGTRWIGPLGLGVQPLSVLIQFGLFGAWMSAIAPKVFQKLQIRV
jgi:hypothetical protein